MQERLMIFSGNANRNLSDQICTALNIKMGEALVERFSEGEIRVKIIENVRGKDIFLVQPTCPPSNDSLMEILIMIDALRRASAGRITAVIPFFGYARQDRKDQPRVPITAKLVANLLTTAGASRVLTVDLHAEQIQGFFDIPVDHLYAMPVLVKKFQEFVTTLGKDNVIMVAPDVGGVKMARAFAKHLGVGLCIVDKRRLGPQSAEVMNILGDVEGKTAIIIDDMIATAGSLTEAAVALKAKGAKTVYAGASHGIFSGPALERIEKSVLETVFVTDTIPQHDKRNHKKITVLSVAKLLAEAIRRIHNEESVSSLFVNARNGAK